MELEGGDFQAFVFKSPGNWTVEFLSQQWPPERQPLYCQSPVIFSCHLQILDYCFRIVFSHNYGTWLVLSDELGCIFIFFFQWCYGSRRETRKHLCREACRSCECHFQKCALLNTSCVLEPAVVGLVHLMKSSFTSVLLGGKVTDNLWGPNNWQSKSPTV